MAHDSIFRVLEDGTPRAEVSDALTRLGYSLRKTWPGNDESAYEEAWATPDEGSAVNYAEDPITLANYVAIRGATPDLVLMKVADLLPTLAPEEVIEALMTATSDDAQVRGLYRLAVTFPELDDTAKEIFEQFSTNAPEERLRDAAVNAIGYRAWPELIPLLEHVEARDPSDAVRASARRILPALRRVAEQRARK